MNILDRIVAATAKRVARAKRDLPLRRLIAQCRELPALTGRPFEAALRKPGLSFICEVKKASPSKGLITESFLWAEIARDYEAAGAACVSVLTEPDFFLGADEHLREISQTVAIPTLRKDFILDPWQIYQSRLLGAKAVLLICSVLGPQKLRQFLALADQLGLSCLTEARDAAELEDALAAGARVVGVNNRDLRTFQVDLQNSLRLRRLAPPSVLFTAESGVASREDVRLLEAGGVDAVLIGETLMRSPNRRETLRALRGCCD
ncbi:MAG: indole-3-glycerol phosphate synthase TrpC [Gracilibacteraceae bacterium]|jgi:indole-3-glycerol phosphate synthase|nr:indole-3-glycerol phosphate synthase TrpC [Gracilibacteraceae bacterium]